MNAISTINSNELPEHFLGTYSEPVFRGTRCAREGSGRFGRLKFDASTAYQLGSNNIGLFVERCPSFERMVEHFSCLQDSNSNWVIVTSSKSVKEELLRTIDKHGRGQDVSFPENVIVSTPEDLAQTQESVSNLAGILVFDYACHIHKCRGNAYRGFKNANDRPQKIVDFRMSCRVGDWSPPIIFFTNRRAISVNTQPMLSPYCLEAFRYIDGQTMRFGKIPPVAGCPQLVAV